MTVKGKSMDNGNNVVLCCFFFLFLWVFFFTKEQNRNYEDLCGRIDSVSVKCDTIYKEVYLQNVEFFD